MKNSKASQKAPYKVKVEKDKTYFWCSCGVSQKQPFCDGAHKKQGRFKSVKYVADEDKILVVEISNLNLPVQVGEIQLTNAVKGLAIDNGYLYAALGSDGVDDR